MQFIGYVVFALGLALIFLGVVGAAKDVFFGAGKGFAAGEIPIVIWGLKVLYQFLKGPAWLMMIAVGLGLGLCFLGGDGGKQEAHATLM